MSFVDVDVVSRVVTENPCESNVLISYATNQGENDDNSYSFGWAINPAVQAANNQYSIMVSGQDNQPAGGASDTIIRNDYAGNSYRDSAQDAAYEINTFDSQGFSVTTRLTICVNIGYSKSRIICNINFSIINHPMQFELCVMFHKIFWNINV